MAQRTLAIGAIAPTIHAPAHTSTKVAILIVHGTFPRGLWQQLRRNLRVSWANIRGRKFGEAEMWPAPSVQPKRRWWFEPGSEFEEDLMRRAGLSPHIMVVERFLWSGRNTFADRDEAARSLRAALQQAARDHPDVVHLVIAHSHGGTIAVKALDALAEFKCGGEIPSVRGLLTLGTPFVRLVSRPLGNPKNLTLSGFVDSRLPILLLLLAPLMSLGLALNGDSTATMAIAIALGISALGALLVASHSTAVAIILIILALGGVKLSQPLITFTSIFAFAVIPYASFLFDVTSIVDRFPLWLRRPFELSSNLIEREPLRLQCPLLALRAPRDEASLVIGLGQAVEGLGYAAAWLVGMALRPLERRFDGIDFGPFPIVLICAMFFLVMITGLVPGMSLVPEGSNWTDKLMIAVHLAVNFGVGALLLWALPTLAISLAAGREAFMQAASTTVEAEPLPNARTPDGLQLAKMDLEILYEARLTVLQHSLYDAPEVRDRIGRWLREQARMSMITLGAEEGAGN